MRVSLNELEVTARKAAIGLGVPLGLAQDAARALSWLAGAGLPALPDMLDALAAYRALEAHRTTDRSLLTLGPSAIDRFLVGEVDQTIGPCAGALLMLGLVACANPRPERIAVTLADATDGVVVLAVNGDVVSLSEAALSGPCTITLSVAPNTASPLTPVTLVNPNGITVPEAGWHTLEVHAARTLVPADARSREKGAGAGLVDRD
jgi:hypothetical protein